MTTSRSGGVARRNFQLGVANGLLFTLAETLLDPTLVLVAFIGHLTHSPLWLGLVTPLRDGAWFLPQLWVSGYLQSQPLKLHLYQWMAVVRVFAWGGLALAAFFVRDPHWLLVTFFTLYGLYALAAGFGGLSFLEIVGKTVPPQRRAVYFAWRLTLGGLAGIGASVCVRWMLDTGSPLQFPYNFATLFALGWVCAMVGLAAFCIIRETPDLTLPPRASLSAQVRRAAQYLRADRDYRHFLSLRGALMIAGAATPFFAVYVQQRLGGSPGMVGVYLGVYTVASLAANALFGRFSARLGNRRTMIAATVAGLLMTGFVLALMLAAAPLGLSGWSASLWLLPVFALSGIRESGQGVSAQSLLLDIAPPSERTLYLGFANSLLGIVLLATGVSGVIVARFGFPALMLAAVAANAFALRSALRLRDVRPSPAPHASLPRVEDPLQGAVNQAHPAP
jgi:MFS transporter